MQHYIYMKSLVRRLYDSDPEFTKLNEEFYRLQAGLAGEKLLCEKLADYPFKKDHFLFFNLEAMNERGFTHQIDALLITPHFVLVFEVKQLSGLLFYKSSIHEFSRQHPDGTIENLTNPFDQVYRHKIFIEQILDNHRIDLPVVQLVVISNYRARLDASLQQMPIIHLSGLPTYLDQLFSKLPSLHYNTKEVSSIFEKIIRPISARRKIERHRIRNGVFCNECDSGEPMNFHYGYWRCQKCGLRSLKVVLEALNDYRILIGTLLSNKEFCEFTDINSRHAAKRLLTRLPLNSTGKSKGRKYEIPVDILEREDEIRSWDG